MTILLDHFGMVYPRGRRCGDPGAGWPPTHHAEPLGALLPMMVVEAIASPTLLVLGYNSTSP
eukprot:924969-Prymnesium_polylepis.1